MNEVIAGRADAVQRRNPLPRMSYHPWFRSQGVELGATGRHAWYWRCPREGCEEWGGPYRYSIAGDLASGAKDAGSAHRAAHNGIRLGGGGAVV